MHSVLMKWCISYFIHALRLALLNIYFILLLHGSQLNKMQMLNAGEKTLIQTLILVSLAFQEACLVWDVESDMRRLENTLSNVKAMLLDAEDKQVHNQEPTV